MKKSYWLEAAAKYIFLVIMCLIFAFPFVWMLSAATNRSVDIIKGKMLPGTYFVENAKNLINSRPLGRVFLNSLRNSLAGTLISLFICSMAGYGFQIYRDKAKDRLMSILLLSMMVPFASVMIPLFRMFSQVRLLNTTAGFILPSLSTAFLIFFFRQSTVSFPMELVQAARVDGLGEFGIYLRVYIPIMAPTFAAAAIVTFMGNWNNYLWPLIILQRQESQTMPLLIAGFTAGYTTDYGMLMLAVAVCTLPTLLIFVTQQRRFVEGILGSVK
jgi:lactose/L-arabinose transport system permease protein